jgi:8-oxo-dGTP diphosphatase
MRSAYGAEEIGIGGHLVTIVVDVANVMGSRPDGWWRDRAGAAARLHAEIVRLAASGRAIPPEGGPPAEAAPPGEAVTPQETVTPGFVLVLEGAAKAAPIPAAPTPAVEPGAADPVQPGAVRVVRARGSGDDAIVAVVRELPGRRVVVTADRELRDRSVAAGATVLRPGWLLGLLRD